MAVCIRCEQDCRRFHAAEEDLGKPVSDACWTGEDVLALRAVRRAREQAAVVSLAPNAGWSVPPPRRRSPFAQAGAFGLGKRR